jgi:hypothetical protein
MHKTDNTKTNRAQPEFIFTVSQGEKSLIECECGRMLATWDDIERAFLNEVTTMFFPDCPCGALIAAQMPIGRKWPTSAMELLAALTVTNIARKAESAPSAELFALGRTVATAHAVRVAEEQGVQLGELIFRHQHGDWGDIHAEDRGLNEAAILDGERIFSVYRVSPYRTFWVITQRDRCYTTVMLPEEY